MVNDATGVKIFKEGLGPVGEAKPGEPKKRSTQADKIAAAAAAVGPGRGGRGRKPEAKGPVGEKRPDNRGPKREGGKPSAPRGNGQQPPRENKPSGRRGEPRQNNKPPRDPALKDRLDYYKSKYGEDFKPSPVEEKSAKSGILGKIASIFGLGKKKEK